MEPTMTCGFLNYTMPEWVVKLMAYEKVADKDIRPT
jgi:hypothetical protein